MHIRMSNLNRVAAWQHESAEPGDLCIVDARDGMIGCDEVMFYKFSEPYTREYLHLIPNGSILLYLCEMLKEEKPCDERFYKFLYAGEYVYQIESKLSHIRKL